MYQVNLGDGILYYPGSDDATIYDTNLNEEIGMAGEFSFKVPPANPLYSELAQGKLVTILKNGIEFWRGEIRQISTDFAKVADVYCLEDLAWLGDEFLTPASITDETYAQRLQAAINAYNTNRSSDRQFAIGYITNVTSSDNCNWTTEYEWSILDCLRNCICSVSDNSGYLRVRRVTSGGVVTRYVDIVKLSDYGVQATQPIEYGYNLLDYVKESDYSNLVNVLTPYGAELDSDVYEEYSARLQGTTISNAASISAFGRHAKVVVFENVDDAAKLDTLAAAYLTRYSQPQLTMEVKAVDLAEIENVDAINLGDSVRIIAAPFAVDQWLYLTQIQRDIQNIDKNTITMSGYVKTGRSLTSQTIGTAETVKNLPSKSSILEAAKKNAIEILNGTNGGNIYFVFDEYGQMIEQGFTNNEEVTEATVINRWNINGKAILTRDNPGDNWNVKVAETIDGGIVADFITSGTMSCDRLDGGAINGQTITGGTITGSTINSPSPQGQTGSVLISGGTCAIVNGTSGYFRVTYNDDHGKYFALGGQNCAGADENAGIYYGDNNSPCPPWGIAKAGYEASSGSDRELKDKIKDIDAEYAKSLIMSLNPVEYVFKRDEDTFRYGLIAQEVRETLEKMGEDRKVYLEHFDGKYRAVEYRELISPLIKVVQNLQNEVASLTNERSLNNG